MKSTLPILALTAALSLTACEKKQAELAQAVQAATEEPAAPKTPEDAAKQVSALQEQLAEIMESVTDTASADKAITKLEVLTGKFAALGKAVEGMDKTLSPEQDAKMKELMKPSQVRLSAAMEKLMPVLQQNPEIAKKFNDVMSRMSPKS